MALPKVEGINITSLIGEGVCGAVYIGKEKRKSAHLFPEADTKYYAVRVFDSMAVNRPAVELAVNRLHQNGLTSGVMPVAWREGPSGNQCLVMPLIVDDAKEISLSTPKTLQHKFGDFSQEASWPLVESIAEAIESLHNAHIAHGNLKPGNIFFDQEGSVLLSDFAMGYMPNISMLSFSDALLYTSPEQIRNSDGYASGHGYQWDVYAFGVLAYRLLTGEFPRCSAVFKEIEAQLAENKHGQVVYSSDDIADLLEGEEIAQWPSDPVDYREEKRREIIEDCLSLEPKARCQSLNELGHLWKAIDYQYEESLAKRKTNKAYLVTALVSCVMTVIALSLGGVIRSAETKKAEVKQRHEEALNNYDQEVQSYSEKIEGLAKELDEAETIKGQALAGQQAELLDAKNILSHAARREGKLRHQLIELGRANDEIVAWVMRTQNDHFIPLNTSKSAEAKIAESLEEFLTKIKGQHEFAPIKARITMQLAELKLLSELPQQADKLLDQSSKLWRESGITDPSRVARARLVCLLQSLDLDDAKLTEKLLVKARADIAALQGSDEIEQKRLHSVLALIDGRMVQETNPEKALVHYELALEELKGIHDKLPDHVELRAEIVQHSLHSSNLADSLMRIDDAGRLRSEAAIHLKWLLKKNPSLEFAKIKLAEMEILDAEEDLRSGNDQAGVAKLAEAESLLAGLNISDGAPDGAGFQLAVASGLSSVVLRDLGRITEAGGLLDRSIDIMEGIVAVNADATEPLYRLAVFYWQRAGIYGAKGEKTKELELGKQSAELMEKVLSLGAGKRSIHLRRSLAYLYGNLGENASSLGKSSKTYYNKAAQMWQKLIEIDGKKDEYSEGLRWSKSH